MEYIKMVVVYQREMNLKKTKLTKNNKIDYGDEVKPLILWYTSTKPLTLRAVLPEMEHEVSVAVAKL